MHFYYMQLMCVGKIFEVCFQIFSFLFNDKGFLQQLLSISFCEVLSLSINMLPHSSPMTPTHAHMCTHMYIHVHTHTHTHTHAHTHTHTHTHTHAHTHTRTRTRTHTHTHTHTHTRTHTHARTYTHTHTHTRTHTHTHTSPKSDSEWQDVDKGVDLEDTEKEHSEMLKSLRKEVPE